MVYLGELNGLFDDAPMTVVVQIDWAMDAPLAEQVAAARRTFAQLAERPASELLEKARRSESLELGVFPRSLAIELQERGKARGLRLSFVDVVE
jgi:hypothetical protein